MDIITVDKANHLYWLGRYAERVYTTIKLYSDGYDSMIDADSDYYIHICELLDIPNIYESMEDFIKRYAYDKSDPNSIISNLSRAYDNAIVMRDEIGTETLAYIQLAIYALESAAVSGSPMMRIQKVTDNLLAFWGCVDDQIDNLPIRSVMKLGKRMERLDLYLRFHRPPQELHRNCMRMIPRAKESGVNYDEQALNELAELLGHDTIDYRAALSKLEQIVNV